MKFMPNIRLLPLLIMVSALSFGVRFGEIVSGKSQAGLALAETAAAPSEAQLAPPSAETVAPDKKTAMVDGAASAAPEPAKDGKDSDAAKNKESATATNKDTKEDSSAEWKDSASDMEFSESRMELFNDLSARRQDIEGREKEVAMREALLKAAEQEIDQKYKELNTLKEEIKNLLKQQSAEEEKRIASLVKIYEGMKAKDAARIFDTLDMDVLIQVLGRMSERKSAPIIAAMSAERARSLTIMLAEQKRLPGGNPEAGSLLPQTQ
jgi:flagellar motility protein MotE (MotC chaperone)